MAAVAGAAVAGGARLLGPGEEGGGGSFAGTGQRVFGGSCRKLGCPMRMTTIRSDRDFGRSAEKEVLVLVVQISTSQFSQT